ncbi:DUF397 domain-containing protein [Streptomyces sp. NBC_01340]|uniref:DUF397 domain-containing protein n=1 Tax=unclassified Streptomyces TaxID=2593676 RepID=UPI00224E6E81|nr:MULTISPECIES: DUF397 domain-containing protein [unclassified Streptomyces]MCX4456354.1 DUF397 domain-containing protein [Streptomyces sp. NBC_01719]MCX4495712.1 DUF397 domain-containing protein [Streptomyces sp. NBC_01728]MCX4589706.1 DUF397 domain-containing protein [Streptomyces sp. NBC_01549]WSI40663.1 DUF397 domain-containing protein [Streptomyces sp. NBC_01340]
MTEFDFAFVKSSYSGGDAGQECVEVARNIPGTVAFRDSKDVDGPIVVVAPSAWAAFAVYVGQRAGRAPH